MTAARLAVALMVAAGACAAGGAPLDTATVDGVTLSLRAEDGGCVLDTGDGLGRPLGPLRGDCAFHRADGALREMRRGDERIVLVESARKLDAEGEDCDTRIAGVAVGPGGVRVGDVTARVAMCPPFRWDDAMFLGLFEE